MATAGGNLSEDQFLCSICLDVFTQPVSLPCGHNFCKACITRCWNSANRHGLCQCPMCKEKFNRRPALQVNCLISEMADHFKKSVQVKEEQKTEAAIPQEVFCDWCRDTQTKAVKSCLVCLTSFCETHLEPHHRVATLKTHQLVEPLGSMEDRICKKHNKILELFCRDEQKCICILCSQTDHRSHDVVALEDESGKRKAEMGKGKTQLEQKIQDREQKLLEIRRSAELNKIVAEKETADAIGVLISLMDSIQRRQAELLEVIDRKQKEVQQKAEHSITELEKEIAELKMTCMEWGNLSHSEDHLKVVMHSLPSPSTFPPRSDCSEARKGWRNLSRSEYHRSPPTFSPRSDFSELGMDRGLSAGTVREAVTKMGKTLNEGMETLKKQLEERHLQVPRRTSSSPRRGAEPGQLPRASIYPQVRDLDPYAPDLPLDPRAPDVDLDLNPFRRNPSPARAADFRVHGRAPSHVHGRSRRFASTATAAFMDGSVASRASRLRPRPDVCGSGPAYAAAFSADAAMDPDPDADAEISGRLSPFF